MTLLKLTFLGVWSQRGAMRVLRAVLLLLYARPRLSAPLPRLRHLVLTRTAHPPRTATGP
jgi:hypothetical protein